MEMAHVNTFASRRAAKACSTCRTRKIRCDVLKVGLPCSQCKENGFDCAIQPRKKRRSKSELQDHGSIATQQDELPEHIIRHQIPHYSFFQNVTPIGRYARRLENSGYALGLPIVPRDQVIGQPGERPGPDSEDLRFLKEKGALDLPTKPLLDICIAAYFERFHPFFPVLDRAMFLSIYANHSGNGQGAGQNPSLLLLQSIIFTACALIPIECVHQMGFASRLLARNSFYTKARYLHQFNYEIDDICTIQALLLISHYYPSMAEQRHTWFWVHQAIGLAQGAGLHRNSGQASQRKIWARIWWACLIRDRMIALGTNRPMHINSLDCDVPFLTSADLKEDGDTEADQLTKDIFLDFTKLCHYMEGVLSLPAATPDSLEDQIIVCETTLQNWEINLSTASRRTSNGYGQAHNGSTPLLYKTLLHLYRNVVITAILQSRSTLSKDRHSRSPSAEVQAIAADSTALLEEAIIYDLVRFFPTSSVTAVLPPLIVQVLLLRSSEDPACLEAAKERFEKCMKALSQLGDIYWHASFYYRFFQIAASSATGKAQTPRTNDPRRKKPAMNTSRSEAQSSSYITNGQDPLEASERELQGNTEEQPTSTEPMLPLWQHDSIEADQMADVDDPEFSHQAEAMPESGFWDFEMFQLDASGNVPSFDDWLNDTSLFSTLFPSA